MEISPNSKFPSLLLTYSKRMTRIELATPAWEAEVLPLNYIRKTQIPLYTKIRIFADFFIFCSNYYDKNKRQSIVKKIFSQVREHFLTDSYYFNNFLCAFCAATLITFQGRL